MKTNTKRITLSAVMLSLSTVLALVCALIPFLSLPFGGGFTVASMLPIVIIAYMYGTKWGLFTAFTYSAIQVVLDLVMGKSSTIIALFTPSSDEYMGLVYAILILLIDYLIAYTLLGFGGIFRNKVKSKTLSLTLGTIFALTLRYLAHIISGAIFYGAWAEWFFTQEGFYKIGESILSSFSGAELAVIYSVFYNGLYMIPEIIITAVCAVLVSRLPAIRKIEK